MMLLRVPQLVSQFEPYAHIFCAVDYYRHCKNFVTLKNVARSFDQSVLLNALLSNVDGVTPNTPSIIFRPIEI